MKYLNTDNNSKNDNSEKVNCYIKQTYSSVFTKYLATKHLVAAYPLICWKSDQPMRTAAHDSLELLFMNHIFICIILTRDRINSSITVLRY